MKYIFIILVVWRVFKAIQKSMRPADMDATRTTAVPQMRKPQAQIESLGAVHETSIDYSREINLSDEASSSSYSRSESVDPDRWTKLQEEAARFLAKTQEPLAPPASFTDLPATVVVGTDVPLTASETRVEMHSAYNRLALVRRGISLDQEALRTFVITREVLGPPRSRSRFRPGGRA